MGRGSIKGISALPGYGGGSTRDDRSSVVQSVVGDEDNEESAYHVHGYLAPYHPSAEETCCLKASTGQDNPSLPIQYIRPPCSPTFLLFLP